VLQPATPSGSSSYPSLGHRDPSRGVLLSASTARVSAMNQVLQAQPIVIHPPLTSPVVRGARPQARGKFIFVAKDKLYVRGVTYGAFRPNEDGDEFHNLKRIEHDFALMAANGITSVRIPHTTPPRSLLDIAEQHGLRVMVGLSAEQYIGYLVDQEGAPDIEEVIRTRVRACAGHPALLCYAIGNEIPASIVRWLGRRRVERYLEWIYRLVKEEDPEGLVTYVNYPSTEYLQLPFLDLVCFNVYLETEEQFSAYLARLQNIAADRPLILTEVGLDSLRNGEGTQAQALDWQIRDAFSAGCAGIYVFSWTDEWYRGGVDVDDWAFGITDLNRQPKPALAVVRDAFTDVPFPSALDWPRVSVVVCTHNGARTIRGCCEGLCALEYPNFEVLVVDDGSTDQTASIASEYGFRVIRIDHGGLSHARNTGLKEASGEIVAYIDDDAYPDSHWLSYVVSTFLHTRHAAIGGPNLTPSGDGPIANCVANSPGNPTHVLLTDEEAEHIPGCNMAFRKAALEKIGGFDPQFWVAGDDVDVCWNLRQHGYSLGFNPAAVVWHHRRNSVRAYWRQQVQYGKAEGMLEKKWPEKYNLFGHHEWRGRIYSARSNGAFPFLQRRIYHGVWGTAPFQSIYEPRPGTLLSLSLTPEWGLVILSLLGFFALGTFWPPLLLGIIPLVFAIGISLSQAIAMALHASFADYETSPRTRRLLLRGLTASLHLLQPVARLRGRLRAGLAPWRRAQRPKLTLPRPHALRFWNEHWQAPEKRLEAIEAALLTQGLVVLRGGDYDRWDLETRGGLFGSARTCMAVEDHGSGRQLVRFRTWPRIALLEWFLFLLLGMLTVMAAIDQAWLVSVILGLAAAGLVMRMLGDCAIAVASSLWALEQPETTEEQESL
jgi:cellulose synthase/poly-beta-1,6-N-acetylglucosamine synthase-like glycosyltransferase